MIITVLRILVLTLPLAMVAASTSTVIASERDSQTVNYGNNLVEETLSPCRSEHHTELVYCLHGHGSSHLLIPEIPHPKLAGNMYFSGFDFNNVDQTDFLGSNIDEVNNHSSIPAIYLTTLRLRL